MSRDCGQSEEDAPRLREDQSIVLSLSFMSSSSRRTACYSTNYWASTRSTGLPLAYSQWSTNWTTFLADLGGWCTSMPDAHSLSDFYCPSTDLLLLLIHNDRNTDKCAALLGQQTLPPCTARQPPPGDTNTVLAQPMLRLGYHATPHTAFPPRVGHSGLTQK